MDLVLAKKLLMMVWTTSDIYGTRVQDEEISLNVPDVLRVHAIFESNTTSDPLLPKITLINKSADLTNAIQGELIIGDDSGATARVVTKTATNVEIIYTNDGLFTKEETVHLNPLELLEQFLLLRKVIKK